MIELGYPCPEDVASMEKTDCGNFCSTCSKDIMDFRDKSMEETKKILAENKSITCGIFNKDQMKKPTVDHVSSLFRIAFAAVFLLGFNMNVLFGQSCEVSSPDHIKVEQLKAEKVKIHGQVLGFNEEVLPDTRIYYDYNETRYELYSDEEGKFELVLDTDGNPPIIGEDITITFAYGGMEAETVYINKIEKETYTITVNLVQREYYRGMMVVPGKIIRE